MDEQNRPDEPDFPQTDPTDDAEQGTEPTQPMAQPPLPPYHYPFPAPAAHSPTHRRHDLRRTLIASGAAAAVFGAGGLGIGMLIAPDHAANATGPSATSTFGDQSGSDGSAGNGFQDLPWSGTFRVPGTAQSTDTTRAATSKELTGLVRIHTVLNYGEGEAAGTGMILTSDGEVVTNHHVVQGSTSIEVTVMSTGKTYTAKVVGTDAKADVAVIQLDNASGLDTVNTDTAGVQVGDKVTAVGDAGGSASQFTAAPGTVSSLDQHITTQSDGFSAGEALTGLIEISSDVASGDSGGATYGSDGRVVGMTTAASTGGGDVDGYAVPIATVLSVADDLDQQVAGADYTYGSPAFLGVAVADGGGTTVQKVYDDSAAAKAGLTAGDRIIRLGSTRVATITGLSAAVKRYAPGDSVSVTWTDTDGKSHTSTVTLGSGPIA